MESGPSLSTYCVYTMRHTDCLVNALQEGGVGTVTENKRWVRGEELFRQARRNDERMPVLFAPAERDGGLIYYAFLDTVCVEDADSKTTYSFSGLTPFDEERPKSSLV